MLTIYQPNFLMVDESIGKFVLVIRKLNIPETLVNEVKFTRVSDNIILKALLLEDF